jgi:hypothetical protein
MKVAMVESVAPPKLLEFKITSTEYNGSNFFLYIYFQFFYFIFNVYWKDRLSASSQQD